MTGFASLRVALVGPLPPPAGGMANQTRQLAALIEAEGGTVEIVRTNAPYRPAFVARLPVVRALFRLVPYLFALWRALGRADVAHVMANSGWSWHLFAAPAAWIGRLRASPVIVNYRGGEADAFLRRAPPWVRWTLTRCSAVVVPSGFLEAVFARHAIAAVIVPNIVDLKRFSWRARSMDRDPVFVVTRNLEPIYDIGTAIRAFAIVVARHARAVLRIAGRGPEESRLRALAASLGLQDKVVFLGGLTPDQVARLYDEGTVLLNASVVDNMPNALIEAMACGLPVVSTNAGGIPYIVEDGRTGLLVAARDPRAMADAIQRVLDDRELAGRIAVAARESIAAYEWTRVRELWLRVYSSHRKASRLGAKRETA